MYNQVLSTAADLTFYSEKFSPFSSEALSKAGSYGLPFSLFGFMVVFGVLALIMVVVFLFGKAFSGSSKSKAPVAKPVKKEETKPAPVVESVPSAPVSNDSDIVAAIVAAITAFRGSCGESGGFRVVSFKKRK